jgi:hypothetical protein
MHISFEAKENTEQFSVRVVLFDNTQEYKSPEQPKPSVKRLKGLALQVNQTRCHCECP